MATIRIGATGTLYGDYLYWDDGEGEIINDNNIMIELQDYVSLISNNFTIQITHIYDNNKTINVYSASRVVNNSFTVYGKNGSFYWQLQGERIKINVEPNKTDVCVKGDVPYKWI